MRWTLIASLLIRLFFSANSPSPQQQITLTDVQIQYQFAETLSIQANFSSGEIPQHATLYLQSTGQSSHQFSLTINASGRTNIQIELNQVQLRPFARVYYWFETENSAGTKTTSPSYWFDYLDNRYTWQTNESKLFLIHWVSGNAAYGQKLQEIAISGLKNATQILPISPDLPIVIYVYPDIQSLQGVLSISDPTWIAGEAHPDLGIVFVSSSTDLNSTNELERQIPHELTHLLEYKLTGEHYAAAPAWLLEGLATNAETSPNADHARALLTAFQSQTLISISQLCTSFSPDSQQAVLAYAESASFVSYLTKRFSSEKITKLLENSNNGMDCSQLTTVTLGENLSSLDNSWQQATFKGTGSENSVLQYWPAFLIVLVILIPLLVIRQKSQKHSKKEFESSDEHKK